MSHDQRPARVKVVGVTSGAGRAADDVAAGAGAVAKPPPATAAAAAAAAAKPGTPAILLSVLFIAGSVIGGIAIALAPLLGGR